MQSLNVCMLIYKLYSSACISKVLATSFQCAVALAYSSTNTTVRATVSHTSWYATLADCQQLLNTLSKEQLRNAIHKSYPRNKLSTCGNITVCN